MSRLTRSKTGKPLHVFTMEEFEEADESMSGYCIRCGAMRECCEPDARKYDCQECGQMTAYGAQELLLMGLVE